MRLRNRTFKDGIVGALLATPNSEGDTARRARRGLLVLWLCGALGIMAVPALAIAGALRAAPGDPPVVAAPPALSPPIEGADLTGRGLDLPGFDALRQR